MTTTEINLTNIYWEMLKSLDDTIKENLIKRLYNSLRIRNTKTSSSKATTSQDEFTEKMLAKFAGAWEDDRSADDIIAELNAMKSSKSILEYAD